MINSEDPPNPPSDDEFADDAPTQIGGPTLSVVASNSEVEEDEGEVTSISQSRGRLTYIVESLLFAADRPLDIKELSDLVGEPDRKAIEGAIETLISDYANRGVQLQQAGSGYQFRTHPEHAGWVQKLFSQKPIKLSRSLLETLSIIAYRQPITRPDIDDIRGVDSGGTIKTLLERSLVRILGKKEEPGRPMLYGTTKEFLEFFHLRDLKDLPTLREFHELSEEHEAEVSALASVAPEGSLPEESDGASQPVSVAPRKPVATFPDDSKELAEIDALLDSVDVKEFKDPNESSKETSN